MRLLHSPLSFLLFFLAIFSPLLAEAGPDFVRFYERGKVRLRQKLYFDAIKDLHTALQTPQGQKHFGAHYQMALASYWLPDIQQATMYLKKALVLARNDAQREAVQMLRNKIKDHYGVVKLIPDVDPEEVGKLKLLLKPKIPFSDAQKNRYYKSFLARLNRQGGMLLNNKPFYLPKGDYEIAIKMNQCLRYGLSFGKEKVREISVGDDDVNLRLQERASCECKGGQQLYKEKNRSYCACKPGSAWNVKNERCEVAKQTASPWPWLIAGGGALVVGGAIVAIVLVVTNNQPEPRAAVTAEGQPFRPWQPATR
jgi:tetratricopeptide (TPR) repeat protein